MPSKPSTSPGTFHVISRSETAQHYFNGAKGGRRHANNNNNKPHCQLCGKFGHIVSYSYYHFDQSFQGPSSFQSAGLNPQAPSRMSTMVASLETVTNTNWYLDFGATNHLISYFSNLMTNTQYLGQDQIYMGDGTGLNILHVGQSSFTLHCQTKFLLYINYCMRL